MDNDSRVLRERSLAAQEALDRSPDLPSDAAAAVLAQTVAIGTYPTTLNVAYDCVAVEIDGEEDEGATATYVATSSNAFLAVNLGSQIPPVGTILICHAVGGRWCFRWDIPPSE